MRAFDTHGVTLMELLSVDTRLVLTTLGTRPGGITVATVVAREGRRGVVALDVARVAVGFSFSVTVRTCVSGHVTRLVGSEVTTAAVFLYGLGLRLFFFDASGGVCVSLAPLHLSE